MVGHKKSRRETEILGNLVKQFGLDEVGFNIPKRSAIWIQITQEFNRITGHDWDKTKLSQKWRIFTFKERNKAQDTVTGETFESLGKYLALYAN